MRARIGLLTVIAALVSVSELLLASRQNDVRAAMTSAGAPPANAIWLDSLDLSKMVQRRQTPRAGQTLAGGRGGGAPRLRRPAPPAAPITLGGVDLRARHRHALDQRAHRRSQGPGDAVRRRWSGLDDLASRCKASVTVEVWVDNKKKFDQRRAAEPAIRR